MSELAFQYIGFGCVFLAALRVMDFVVHILLGIAFSWASLDRYYLLSVEVMSRTPSKSTLVSYTGTARDDD